MPKSNQFILVQTLLPLKLMLNFFQPYFLLSSFNSFLSIYWFNIQPWSTHCMCWVIFQRWFSGILLCSARFGVKPDISNNKQMRFSTDVREGLWDPAHLMPASCPPQMQTAELRWKQLLLRYDFIKEEIREIQRMLEHQCHALRMSLMNKQIFWLQRVTQKSGYDRFELEKLLK